jgi:signal transduction histidine kinase
MRVVGHLRGVAHSRPHLADLAVALVVLLVTLLTTSAPQLLRDGLAVLLAAVACGVLLARRRWPYATLVVSAVAAEAYLARFDGSTGTLILAAPLVALYTLAESKDRRRSLLIAGLLVLGIGAFHTLGRPDRFLGPENIALAALGGLAVAAGEAARNRRAYLAEVLLRAEDAERDREVDARRRIAEERLRIARDLHDSVGHHLALINVQAGVAGHLMTGEEGPVRETFDQIRRRSRVALEELRDSVGLLRQPDEPPAPVEPTVGLAGLGELVAEFERSGLRIAGTRDGAGRALPWATDLTAYRVIQESLTNVCKHVGATDVRLTLRRDPETLTIIVENDGPPAPGSDPPAGTHGIVGMRERVAAIGGTLLAGPRPAGGFRVAAVLPAPSGGAG